MSLLSTSSYWNLGSCLELDPDTACCEPGREVLSEIMPLPHMCGFMNGNAISVTDNVTTDLRTASLRIVARILTASSEPSRAEEAGAARRQAPRARSRQANSCPHVRDPRLRSQSMLALERVHYDT